MVINAAGDIVVNGKNGEQITIPGEKDTIITDANGKVYSVDKNGNGSNEGIAAAEGGKSTPENTDGVDKTGQVTEFTAKGISIAFSGNNSKYAYDVMPENATADLEKQYIHVGKTALSYKAVLNGDTDTVLATATITDTSLKPEDIVFKTQSGAKVDAVRNGNTFTLTVKGTLTYAEEQILATIKQGDKWKTIGAFMLVHISPKEVNVALVPTDDVSQNKLDGTIKNTQEIYNKVGVKINFTKQPVLDISSVVTGSIIQTQKNTLTSTYSVEQQDINELYKGANDRYVLFVTNKKSSTGQQGYMRLNGQFGYVFAPPSGAGGLKTAAHELGHGIFKLEHPFEQYKTAENSTDFLMDYANGTVLNHMDWKQINNPAFKLYAFQSQASGEQVDKDFVLKEDGYFLTPSNKLIKLPKGTQIIFTCDQPQQYQNGALFSFKTPDGFYWHDTTKFALNEKIFDGYFKADAKGWVRNNGNLISYADSNFKYDGAGKYPVYIINMLTVDNKKSEYRILKQEMQLSTQQISTTNTFVGNIVKLTYQGNDGLVETITSTGCKVKPEEELGNYITDIVSKDEKAILKIYQNTLTGKYTVIAELKGEGNTNTRNQKTAIEKQMSALATQKINELGGLDKEKSKPIFETTDDGGGFYVKDMNGQEWLGTICDLGSNVWENAALPENYWNQDDKEFKDSTIHLPPTLSGVSDGAIDLVSDYPQLVKLAYDIGTKEEVRSGIWTAVKNITPNSILDAATGAVKNKWDKYANSKPFVTSHELGKDGVAVASALMGASFITGGEDALENSVEKTGKEIASKADDVLLEGVEGVDNITKKSIKEAIAKGDLDRELVDEAKDEINDLASKKGNKLSWEEVQKFFKRGNDFNKKGRLEYGDQFSEIHLGNNKRLDNYIPGEKIISRKATDLDNITEQTWRNYCNELVTKYKVGTPVNSSKLLNEPPLKGKYYLEIPLTNQSGVNLEKFKKIAKGYGKDNGGIEIIFLNE